MSKSSNGGLFALGALAVGGLFLLANSPKPHTLSPLIKDLYRRVGRHFAFPLPPLVEDHSVDNAQSDGRSIKVNPSWVAGVLSASCDSQQCHLSFIAGVLAHELGHHAHRVKGVRPGQHEEELYADHLAGQALRAAGFSMNEFRSILARISGHGSATHPPGWQRSNAIERGYHGLALT